MEDKMIHFTMSIDNLPPKQEVVFEHKLGIIPNFVQLGRVKDTSAIRFDLNESYLKLEKDSKHIRVKNMGENYVFHNLKVFVLAVKRIW